MSRNLLAEILELSPSERIQLAQDIWDSVEAEAIPVRKTQQEELGRRLMALDKDPEQGVPWEEIRKELYARK